MKNSNYIIGFIILFFVGTVSSQTEGSFIFLESGLINSFAIDAEGNFHTFEKINAIGYYGKYDNDGQLLQQKIKICTPSDTSYSPFGKMYLHNNYLLFAWSSDSLKDGGQITYRKYIRIYNLNTQNFVAEFTINATFFEEFSLAFLSDTLFAITYRVQYLPGVDTRDSGVYCRIMSVSGRYLTSEIPIEMGENIVYPKLLNIPESNSLICFYNSTDGIYGKYIDQNGVPLDSSFFVATEKNLRFFYHAIVKQNQIAIVFWNSSHDVRLQWLDAGGNLIGSPLFMANLATNSEYFQFLITEEDDNILLYDSYDGEFPRISTQISDMNGILIRGPSFISNESFYYSDLYNFSSPVAVKDTIYYIGWGSRNGESEDSWISRFQVNDIPNQLTINDVPSDYKIILDQNSPNPFNNETVIPFSIPENMQINLSLYNCLGQKVKNIFTGPAKQGEHRIKLMADDIPSGVYYYQLRTDKELITKKCLLLK